MRKIFSIVGNVLAVAVLGGALVYYNFIDKPIKTGVEVGDVCPDFTVSTYTTENGLFETGGKEFTLSAQRGKIVVINFWATYCGPCIAELPEFNEIQETYAEDVTVITLDGELSYTEEKLAAWLNTNAQPTEAGWNAYSLLFGRYESNTNNVYQTLGFSSGALPATLIVNREGEIVFKKEGNMSYTALEEVILPLLKF